MSRWVVTAALVAAVLGGMGCKRVDAAPAVVSIEVVASRAAPALAEAGVAPAEVEGLARTALVGAGFRLDGEGRARRAFRARAQVVSLRLAPGPGGEAWSEAVVEIDLLPASGAAAARAELGEAGQGSAALGSAPSAAWRAAIADAARDSASRLAIVVAAEDKPVRALLADLGEADPRVRESAVAALGERRSTEAVPALLRLLESRDPRLADRAAGALTQIRDPRAVGPLIDLSRRRPPAEQARYARLIGDIGGPEARAYLETLAAGASEPLVRRAATEALEVPAAEAPADPGAPDAGER